MGWLFRRLGALAATAMALVAVQAVPQAAAAPPRDPVVFVHGIGGSAASWDTMRARLLEDGYTARQLHAITYDSAAATEVTAARLGGYIDQVRRETGAGRVDVITHSMGGLNSRYWMKFGGGAAKVDDWVSLGGPNHGTTVADACDAASCRDMRPGSKLLTKLNRGEETPGRAHYATFRSTCDAAIKPPESTILRGAHNVEVGCVRHEDLVRDPGVYQQVRRFVH